MLGVKGMELPCCCRYCRFVSYVNAGWDGEGYLYCSILSDGLDREYTVESKVTEDGLLRAKEDGRMDFCPLIDICEYKEK